MKEAKFKHRIVTLANSLNSLRLERIKVDFAKILFNSPLLLLMIVFILQWFQQ